MNCDEGSFNGFRTEYEGLKGVSYEAYMKKIRNYKHRIGYFSKNNEPVEKLGSLLKEKT